MAVSITIVDYFTKIDVESLQHTGWLSSEGLGDLRKFRKFFFTGLDIRGCNVSSQHFM